MLKSLTLGVVLGTIVALLLGRRKQIAELARTRRTSVEPAPVGSAAAVPPPSADRAAEDEDLERLTRPELYRRAKEAGIAGRSEMSKAQLIAALRAGRSGPH
jgi:hypothetical protein